MQLTNMVYIMQKLMQTEKNAKEKSVHCKKKNHQLLVQKFEFPYKRWLPPMNTFSTTSRVKCIFLEL